MDIKLAHSAGFCFGVRRAVEMVYREIGRGGGLPIFTFGPIIHNMEVVRDLEAKGVTVINGIEELAAVEAGNVIIRAHGVARHIHDLIRKKGLEVVDATCPHVERIHRIAYEAKKLIITGDPGHPEVEGITGWARGEVFVVETGEDARRLASRYGGQKGGPGGANWGEKHCIVSQTTFNHRKFQDMVDIFIESGYNGNVVNTICNATEERQIEAARIAAEADVMIVIGDVHSSNTAKLFDICQKECQDTYFVQTVRDLPPTLPQHAILTGITAGASTPNKIIEEVCNHVRINF